MNKEKLKKELKERIENITIDYNYDETYDQLYNNVIDYMNATQDFDLEYLFEDFIDYDLAEEQAKWELENGGLARLSCFLGDVQFYGRELFRINGYGNLENIEHDDLEILKQAILEEIDTK